MRCQNRNCNHILSDFETTRKNRDGTYLDLCVYCCPYDPVEHKINPKHPYLSRDSYNENEWEYLVDEQRLKEENDEDN